MTVLSRKSNLPHIEWIDLKNNGVLVECAVMKRDEFGNTYFLELPILDAIDKSRIARLLQNRNVHAFELWDLMSQTVLGNGVNALLYFHQLVKIITPDGVIMNPRAGTVGVGRIDTNNTAQGTNAQTESVNKKSKKETREEVE